jgi:prepilin-type N-terminal cleavage/methylation domain-containing protein
MASSTIIQMKKSKGFTLLEVLIVLALFTVAVSIISQIYINLIKASVLAQDMQLSLDNVRFAVEKIWLDIKNGSYFVALTARIEFLDRKCRLVKIYLEDNNLVYEIDNRKFKLFNDNLVFLKNFQIYYDIPSGDSDFYFGTANKIFVIHYQADLKTKTLTIPFEFRQAVAPSNSIFFNSPCQ